MKMNQLSTARLIMLTDKQIEKLRYEDRAKRYINSNKNHIKGIKKYLLEPYEYYYEKIYELVNSESSVLEIGCGIGEHSDIPVNVSGSFTAMDISSKSLCIFRRNMVMGIEKINTVCADIEKLPFSSENFDVVLSAGSLSYGDNHVVMTEINRVLKEGGYFICVDSLNNNLIYKMNRFLHYLAGNRSASTLKRMPNLKLLEVYKNKFSNSSVNFFGSITYLAPVIGFLFDDDVAYKISKKIDRMIRVKSSAFKFVMVLKK